MPTVINGQTYFTIADSINPSALRDLIDSGAQIDALLGYVDGRWPDYAAIASWAKVPVFGLTVFGNPAIGDGTDSEPGDATIAQCVTSTRGELARGVDRPLVYCPASWAAAMVAAHSAAGVARSRYRLVTAHYQWGNTIPGFQPGQHFCGPATCGYGPGADGTQWWNGPNYDLTIAGPGFLTVKPPYVPPAPLPPLMYITTFPGDQMQAFSVTLTFRAGNGWIPTPVPAAHVVGVNILSPSADGAPDPGPLPAVKSVATAAGPSSPNGSVIFEDPKRPGDPPVPDGTYGVELWAVTG